MKYEVFYLHSFRPASSRDDYSYCLEPIAFVKSRFDTKAEAIALIKESKKKLPNHTFTILEVY